MQLNFTSTVFFADLLKTKVSKHLADFHELKTGMLRCVQWKHVKIDNVFVAMIIIKIHCFVRSWQLSIPIATNIFCLTKSHISSFDKMAHIMNNSPLVITQLCAGDSIEINFRVSLKSLWILQTLLFTESCNQGVSILGNLF